MWMLPSSFQGNDKLNKTGNLIDSIFIGHLQSIWHQAPYQKKEKLSQSLCI